MPRTKMKVLVDPRRDYKELDGKLTYEQFGGGFLDDDITEVPDAEQFSEAMDGAGWTDDPRDGKAILMPDGRELLNPGVIAPPVDFFKEPSVNDLIARAMKMHFDMLKADEEIDTIAEADDFGEDEDFFPSSIYEIVLRDEAPAAPVGDKVDEAKASDIDKVEEDAVKVMKDTAKKAAKKPPSADLDGEEA